MLKRIELPLEELGELAAIIPGPEPDVEAKVRRVPGVAWSTSGEFIPVCEPSLTGNELKYLTRCIETNWVSSTGRYVEEFEARFAACCGARYGISCTSGTTALHLAVAATGVGPGDEVIIPAFTMIATANAVAYTGAKPVLADSEPRTWNIDPKEIARKITPRTRALIPMHTYGHPAAMDKVMALAKKHKLFVIEDAAEAHGAEFKGRRVGGLGHAACFSFYGNKIITTGEGGMVTTNDRPFADLARNLHDHAFSSERHFWHKCRGFNYRMTNLQAAVGLAQVERFDELVEARIRNAKLYNELFADVPGITRPPSTKGVKNVYWMYGILVEDEFGLTRDRLRIRLAKQGIETRCFFIPMHVQPIYYRDYQGERYPVAENLCKRGLYLPSSPTLTPRQIEFIVDTIKAAR